MKVPVPPRDVKPQTVYVSDHALLRFLERVCGIEVEAFRAEISKGCARGVEAGAPTIRFSGAKFLIRNRTVVTVLEARKIVPHQKLILLMRGDR